MLKDTHLIERVERGIKERRNNIGRESGEVRKEGKKEGRINRPAKLNGSNFNLEKLHREHEYAKLDLQRVTHRNSVQDVRVSSEDLGNFSISPQCYANTCFLPPPSPLQQFW